MFYVQQVGILWKKRKKKKCSSSASFATEREMMDK